MADFPTASMLSAAQAFISQPTPSSDVPADVPSTPPPPAPVELAPAATPTPTEGLDAVPSSAELPPESTPAPEPIELDDTKLYRVKTKVDGVETVEVVTGAEVLRRQMNARKFTQSMQQVREIERGLVQERQSVHALRQQAAEAQAILSDRARLSSYIQQQYPGLTLAEANALAAQQQQAFAPPQPQGYEQPQQPGYDPDSLASVGDIQSRVQAAEQQLGRRLTEFETSLVQRIQAAEAAMEGTVTSTLAKLAEAHEVAGYDNKIESTIESLKAELPALAQIPDINDLLRFKVKQARPQSPDELFHLLDATARGIADGLASVFTQQHQAATAAKARMVATGALPPAGTPPTFQRKISHRDANGKFDWNQLMQDAKARASLS